MEQVDLEGIEDHDGDQNFDLAFGKSILRLSVIGLPVMVVFLTVGLWFIADLDWGTAIATALLPGVLFGVFGGGFVGMLRAMEH
ncbi:MAG: hypothetical protein F4Y75_02605 [Acidimicrobiia bacterium]|nr:hypothetical protein [bacterium]MXZ06397.1 hypothetical protein [Acidimicrobiia bacterium]MCY3580607.1 hypothetical protein [bacterium]MCY3652408.1 hypothetical protein [bacterium]MYF26052.1 hypothetical protein [Acidimicrobiia bacterium]